MKSKEYIGEFCNEYGFPAEAAEELCAAYDTIYSDKESFDKFKSLITMYENGIMPDGEVCFKALGEISEKLKLRYYMPCQLYMIYLVPHLWELYQEKGYSYKMLYETVCDLKWKSIKCKKLHGVWGSFTAGWQIDFFQMKRFALGRFQFEIINADFNYEKNGRVIKEGDEVINVHIPAAGRLNREEYLESYRLAAEFFKEHFKGVDEIPFVCYSWMLHPSIEHVTKEGSGLRTFYNDYDVFAVHNDKDEVWRLFFVGSLPENLDTLPKETSLQRNLIEWLKGGNEIGNGFGIFFWKDGILSN